MSARQLATVAFAIVGVVFLVDAAVSVSFQLATLWADRPRGWDDTSPTLWSLAAAGVYFLAGLWLVWRGHRLAGRLFPEGDALASDLDIDRLLMASLLVLGTWSVATGLGKVARQLLWDKDTMDVHWSYYPLGDVLTGMVGIAIGMFLILKPRRIVGAWRQHALGEGTGVS